MSSRKKIETRVGALLAALIVVVALMGYAPDRAHAAAPGVTTAGGGGMAAQITCPSGRLCTYWDTFWWGDMYYYSMPTPPQSLCTRIGSPWINNISSARNYTGHAVKFHDDGSCGNGSGYTTTYVLNSGSSMDWGGTIWNDEWSSIQWL